MCRVRRRYNRKKVDKLLVPDPMDRALFLLEMYEKDFMLDGPEDKQNMSDIEAIPEKEIEQPDIDDLPF